MNHRHRPLLITVLSSALAVFAAVAAADDKPKSDDAPACCQGKGARCDREGGCPMHELHALAEVKVESTKDGALLRVVAKNPADAAKVQELAKRIAEHMQGGGCKMGGHPGHPGHGGHKGHR